MRMLCRPADAKRVSYSDWQRDSVLLESHLANGLRPSFAQARWKECASLSQSEKLAPRTSGVAGLNYKEEA